jgi:hypothetical protein
MLCSWRLRLSRHQYITYFIYQYPISLLEHCQKRRYTQMPHRCICSTFYGCCYSSHSSTLLPVFFSSTISVHMSAVSDKHVTYSAFWASCHIQKCHQFAGRGNHKLHPPPKRSPTTKLPVFRVKWIFNNTTTLHLLQHCPIHKINNIINFQFFISVLP